MPIGHVLNWDEVAATSWEDTKTSLPPGYYKIQYKDGTLRERPATANKPSGRQLVAQFAVLLPEEFKGMTLFQNFNIPTSDTDPTNLRWYKIFLEQAQEAMSVPIEDRNPPDPDTHWAGQVCYARAEEQEYQGVVSSRITRFLRKLPATVHIEGDDNEE